MCTQEVCTAAVEGVSQVFPPWDLVPSEGTFLRVRELRQYSSKQVSLGVSQWTLKIGFPNSITS